MHTLTPHTAAGWHVSDFLLRGYFQGKRDAEKHLAEKFPTSGVALRPSFIYGSRAVGSASIPLGAIGAPLAVVRGRWARIGAWTSAQRRVFHMQPLAAPGAQGVPQAAEHAQPPASASLALRPVILGWAAPPNYFTSRCAQMLRALPTRNLSAVPIVGAAFVPPISVDAVAKAAVTAVVDPAVPPGPMDVWTIAKYA